MVSASITVPERDLIEFRRVMAMLQTELHKTPEQAVEFAATFAVRALHSATKVSAKLRPVVKNKDPRAGKDKRIAVWGVWRLRQEKEPKWVPIFSTGEFGRIRFLSKTKALDTRTGIVMDTGTDEFQIPGIMQSPKRKIGHRGLAQRMWSKANMRISGESLATSGDSTDDRIAETNMVVTRQGGEDASIQIHNKAKYALLAFKTNGRATVSNTMRRAANSMRKYIERQTGLLLPQRNIAE